MTTGHWREATMRAVIRFAHLPGSAALALGLTWLVAGCPSGAGGDADTGDDDTTAPPVSEPFTLVVVPDVQFVSLATPRSSSR